jgi:hypothetical protein
MCKDCDHLAGNIGRKSADLHHKMLPQKQVQIETQINSIQRFYDRVCTFTSHLPRADPLVDVFIDFMKK